MAIDLRAHPDTWHAGRELDASVAEAMGLDVISGTEFLNAAGQPFFDVGYRINEYLCKKLPPYSTTWEAMELAIRWLCEAVDMVDLGYNRHNADSEKWACELDYGPEAREWCHGIAPTAPLAVARALLIYARRTKGDRTPWHAAS